MKYIKKFIHLVIIYNLFVVDGNIDNDNNQNTVGVYILTNKSHFFLALTSILSLNNYISNLNYFLIDDGSLKRLHYLIVNHLKSIKITIINDFSEIESKISKYPYCSSFFNEVWSGKKIFIPLLNKRYKKCIILDSDTIFFSKPKTIINWINDKHSHNYYLKDYMNFSVISVQEALFQLGVKINTPNLNSGLLCINLDEFWKNNSLSQINTYIRKMINILKSRMTRDYFRNEELWHFIHIMEQSIYQLTLSKCQTVSFSQSYSMLTSINTNNKITFVHFTPDVKDKEVFYNYLIYALKNWVKSKIYFYHNLNQWYLSGSINIFMSNLVKQKKYRSNENNILKDMKVLLIK
jgi:hypothetical protein